MVFDLEPDKLPDGARDEFVEVVLASLNIKSHLNLYSWLQGPFQRLLPHDIFVAAWGDFSRGLVYYDVLAEVPGFRTGTVPYDNMIRLLSRLFNYWEGNGGDPYLLNGMQRGSLDTEIDSEAVCRHFRCMESVLVHGAKDFRGRNDCLYVLMERTQSQSAHAATLLNALMPHIDASLRKIPPLPEQMPRTGVNQADPAPDCRFGMTARETQIMNLVRSGKTNVEIGMILDISVFTVKNHLQHIFKKLNVNNRAQAVSKCRSG